MFSLGASSLLWSPVSKIKRQLCCVPAITADRTWRVIHISRVCLRAEESFRFLCCSYMLLPACASLCTWKCVHPWLSVHLFWFLSLFALLRCSFPFIKYKPQCCVSFQSNKYPECQLLSWWFHYVALYCKSCPSVFSTVPFSILSLSLHKAWIFHVL